MHKILTNSEFETRSNQVFYCYEPNKFYCFVVLLTFNLTKQLFNLITLLLYRVFCSVNIKKKFKNICIADL